MAKRTSLLILIVLAILLLIAGVLFLLFSFVFKKPLTISDCKNSECVKTYIATENFNPQDCAKAAENLRNDCYYTYEIGNLITKKTKPGQYCWSVKDEDLGADCVYKTLGLTVITTNIKENLLQAVTSLNTENCDKINRPEWREQCIKDVGVVKKALDEKNMSLCFDSGDISSYSRQICVKMVQDKMIQDLLIKKTK